jgi:ribosomal-protein-alanine N-acetyltransferase
VIETPRLELYALTPLQVARLVAGDVPGAQELAPSYDLTRETFADDAGVLEMRHTQLRADPSEAPWLLRVAVRRGTRRVIGRIGFHSRPSADGTVEVGYSVAPADRRQGYATEMVQGLLSWGAASGATRCLASVRPDNAASLATIAALGFVRIGEQIDEIDGLEWVHCLDLAGSTMLSPR